MTDKIYIRHTGYPGGQRYETPAEMLVKHPTRIIETAVKGMLPTTDSEVQSLKICIFMLVQNIRIKPNNRKN